MRERDIMMKMMSMYIISSWREHLQEAEDGMGDGVGWLGGRWGVTLYFSLLLSFLVQAALGGVGDCPDLGEKIESYTPSTTQPPNPTPHTIL